MGTRDTLSGPRAEDLITDLAALGEDRRGPAADLISGLRDLDYSWHRIARETGIPRTTLHRWAETTA
jgi:transcriptional regulator of acetoin/glycerol metabolism